MSLIFCSAGQDINQNDKVFAVWGEKKEREINAEGFMLEMFWEWCKNEKLHHPSLVGAVLLQESAGVREEREWRENWATKISKKEGKSGQDAGSTRESLFWGCLVVPVAGGHSRLWLHTWHTMPRDGRTPLSLRLKLISALSARIFPNSASLSS